MKKLDTLFTNNFKVLFLSLFLVFGCSSDDDNSNVSGILNINGEDIQFKKVYILNDTGDGAYTRIFIADDGVFDVDNIFVPNPGDWIELYLYLENSTTGEINEGTYALDNDLNYRVVLQFWKTTDSLGLAELLDGEGEYLESGSVVSTKINNQLRVDIDVITTQGQNIKGSIQGDVFFQNN